MLLRVRMQVSWKVGTSLVLPLCLLRTKHCLSDVRGQSQAAAERFGEMVVEQIEGPGGDIGDDLSG